MGGCRTEILKKKPKGLERKQVCNKAWYMNQKKLDFWVEQSICRCQLSRHSSGKSLLIEKGGILTFCSQFPQRATAHNFACDNEFRPMSKRYDLKSLGFVRHR